MIFVSIIGSLYWSVSASFQQRDGYSNVLLLVWHILFILDFHGIFWIFWHNNKFWFLQDILGAMKALGLNPGEQEVVDMTNEVSFLSKCICYYFNRICVFSKYQKIIVQIVQCICQIELWRPQVVDNWTWQTMLSFAFFVKIENLTSVYSSFFCVHISWFILLNFSSPKLWAAKSQSRARLVNTSVV